MPSSKELRRRIKSIRSTRQITRAMELVAAAKMRKAQIAALKSRPYAVLIWDLVGSLSEKVQEKLHALLRRPTRTDSVAIILMTSNRGLAGSFNTQIIARALSYIQELREENSAVKIDLIVVGKKGAVVMVKAGQQVVADFKKTDVNVTVADVLPIALLVSQKYMSQAYDRVVLAYMDFISTLQQKPRIKKLLPFPGLAQMQERALKDDLGRVSDPSRPPATLPRPGEGRVRSNQADFDYLFEPTPDQVLAKLLSRIVEMQIYQAAVETNASEHSARMVAMKNASDAAGDLISDLTLEYNQLRQAGITKEIAEISAGRLALD